MTDDEQTAQDANAADTPLVGEVVDEGEHGAAGSGAGSGAAEGGAGPGPSSVAFTTATAEVTPADSGRGSIALGAVLVSVGAVILAGRFNDVVAAGGAALVIGVGFLAWWAVTGNYGLLVPAGVLTGLGGGMMLDKVVDFGNPVALGLGVGFVAIYVLDLVRRRHSHWWPLIPGVVLVVVGLLQNTSGWKALGELGWPLFLIIVGLLILTSALYGRNKTR